MRFPEFLINLFIRFAPVDKETLANLKIELMQWFSQHSFNLISKQAKNAPIIQKMDDLEKVLDNTDPHTEEHKEALFEFEKLRDRLENPTLMEKAIAYLEKPWMRVAMLIGFVLISRFIMKKLTQEPEPEQPEQQPATGYQNQPYYQNPPPYYQPYGFQPYQHQAPPPGYQPTK